MSAFKFWLTEYMLHLKRITDVSQDTIHIRLQDLDFEILS